MIRDAQEKDNETLTRISFLAKRHWGYPDEYFQKWNAELTITEKYISENIVRCKELNGEVVGFYSLINVPNDTENGKVFIERGIWLDHMFIFPKYHGQKIGTEFFADLEIILGETLKVDSVKIFVDPNSSGFYEKMGSKLLRSSPSSIPGRDIPVYTYRIR